MSLLIVDGISGSCIAISISKDAIDMFVKAEYVETFGDESYKSLLEILQRHLDILKSMHQCIQ